jgi:protoporphyrinogen oxidase
MINGRPPRMDAPGRPLHVGIIGGGISGLTAAYWLLKTGHQATVYEAAPEVGGLASSVQVQGVWVDKFYHCILPSDTALLDLVRELGLGDNIYWQETEMGFLHRRRLYPLTTPRDLLRFSPLSIIDRVRLGVTGLYARRLRDWRALEQVTAREWLMRLCGERAFNTIWKPLLTFKFGPHWRDAPATYLWARVKRQGSTHKGSQRESLAYVRGGFKLILSTLADEVRRLGGTVRTSTRVDRVEIGDGRIRGLTVGGRRESFDKVVSTVPITQFLKLVDAAQLGDDFRHDGLAYQASVCVMLVLKEPLTRYYWVPAVDSGVSFAGIVETTNLIRRDDLGGISLVYLVNYVPREDLLFSADPGALIARSVAELANAIPSFSPAQILESHVFRAAFVEPVWTIRFSERLPQRVMLDDSLFVLTTAQLYPEINSTSNCVAQVRDVFDRLAAPAGAPTPPSYAVSREERS